MMLCTVKARAPDAEHTYTGLFQSVHMVGCVAYKRFGFHTAITVTPIGIKPAQNIFHPMSSRAA
ncbi:hypothetical protein FUT69_00645 [Xylella taiwanensis]|uniref:Uncharacterized protein n=1 Tax=Xylella taiwanensis TaxID=1444770 RepID=Z9JM10_9GAMM|nr:hypothetical protein [Xylella taiwanensis]AXI83139.1 hypothetical protein AB672_03870 [Xylella taiwanensis]EWS78802.1 hypothetical protein AF72_04315 [Xylella taiwanensis]MCD8460729.1 hypothetical protein [Xylella taiwanensis]MCD8465234.1 hypothetical protein [Xylella taiwanensis]MCD8467207.1 hypothetical protein [Xylella taiwanensis]